jgi:hypothetical protein
MRQLEMPMTRMTVNKSNAAAEREILMMTQTGILRQVLKLLFSKLSEYCPIAQSKHWTILP